MKEHVSIVVMGVSGCGKSTVAALLAERLGLDFKDADDLHPQQNIARMSAGLPLRDSDRMPWLDRVVDYALSSEAGACVIACSALKKVYRQRLNQAGRVLYIYLDGSRDLIGRRLRHRSGHFMPQALLESQFSALEVPDSAQEEVLSISIDAEVVDVVDRAEAQLRTHPFYLSYRKN